MARYGPTHLKIEYHYKFCTYARKIHILITFNNSLHKCRVLMVLTTLFEPNDQFSSPMVFVLF